MKLIKRALAAVALAIVLLLALAYALPGHYRVTREITIRATPEHVYALVATPRAWTRWSAWNARDPAMRVVYEGPAAGIGAKWSWDSRSEGRGSMTITDAVVGEGIRYALVFPDAGARGEGALRLRREGPDATRVTWTHEGEAGANPALRLLAPWMDELIGPDFESGLANLKRQAEGS